MIPKHLTLSTTITTLFIYYSSASAILVEARMGQGIVTNLVKQPSSDRTLALLLPLLVLVSTLLLLLLLFLLFLIVVRSRRGLHLSDNQGPIDVSRDVEHDAEGGLSGLEQRWMESVDDALKSGYMRAKAWQAQYPPNSQPTDITLSQYLSIQEKGVAAWSFEPDYEANPPLMVQSRTEIVFLHDGNGLAPSEGGGASVLSNLPLPRQNEVYYFECKMFDKPPETTVAVGLATKPYPWFRLPGWNKYSVGYSSADGFKSYNYPFNAQSYGPPLVEGDVIGVGFRPRTGAVFFTRNGKKMDEAFVGMNRFNVFPIVGANGMATVHVNLGQAGFVFIEANVKKWGLAPSTGTLAPPPAYGAERDSILLASAAHGTPNPPPLIDEGNNNNNNRQSSQNNSNGNQRPGSRRHHQQGSIASSSRNRLGQSRSQPQLSSPLAATSASTSVSPSSSSQQQQQQNLIPTATANANANTNTNPTTSSSIAIDATRSSTSTPSTSSVPTPGPRSSSRAATLDNNSSNHYSSNTSTPSSSRPIPSQEDDEQPVNPPTPNMLDISLHSLNPLGERERQDESDEGDSAYENESDSELRRSEFQGGDENVNADTINRTGNENNNNNNSNSNRSQSSNSTSSSSNLPADQQQQEQQQEQATSPQQDQRRASYERPPPHSSRTPSPPAYASVDPNMYPDGVYQVMLTDQLGGNSNGSSSPFDYENRARNRSPMSSSNNTTARNNNNNDDDENTISSWLSWIAGSRQSRT